jgi:hypothetical protein
LEDNFLLLSKGTRWCHEFINVTGLFIEFPALLSFLVIVVMDVFVLPDLTTFVLIAVAIIVNNEIIITSFVLSGFVFVFVDIFENLSGFFDLILVCSLQAFGSYFSQFSNGSHFLSVHACLFQNTASGTHILRNVVTH